MKVSELIEKLQEMDQNSVVNTYGGYDYHNGDQWGVCSSVEQEVVRWDKDCECSVVDVFIR